MELLQPFQLAELTVDYETHNELLRANQTVQIVEVVDEVATVETSGYKILQVPTEKLKMLAPPNRDGDVPIALRVRIAYDCTRLSVRWTHGKVIRTIE
jgi:hypothetical protein